MTRFAKTCIVHTSKFSTLVTHNIYLEWHIDTKLSGLVEQIFLKVSNLYATPCGFYGSPNEQNRMCELCIFSQIWSHLSNLLFYFCWFTFIWWANMWTSSYNSNLTGRCKEIDPEWMVRGPEFENKSKEFACIYTILPLCWHYVSRNQQKPVAFKGITENWLIYPNGTLKYSTKDIWFQLIYWSGACMVQIHHRDFEEDVEASLCG